ncbi:MAG: division/cell wall cluster transcriptional repressor MraZ [Chloroflexia bacterium]|nr:division/cell wall cluster transcriptional repressor MraZ [Chloroflexia bacterium]
MFLGRFENRLDEKGRLSMPAKFRPRLAEGFVITRGFEQCLTIFPMPEWQTLADNLARFPVTDQKARALRRVLFAQATDTELDRQGRMLIPEYLREAAGLGADVIVAGMDGYIEIWDVERWREMERSNAENANDIAQSLADLGM